MSDLFIGVVSHARSRFSDSQGPDGLAQRLASSLSNQSVKCQVRVNTQDFLETSARQVTPALARSSPAEELRIEREWARFLGMRMGPRWWANHGLRWGKYASSLVRQPDTRALARLINIELSHLDLMHHAVESGAEWALILEDDAGCSDVEDLADGLIGLMRAEPAPAFANVSQSFTLQQLGVIHLLTPVASATWSGASDRALLRAAKPATNTVCAILYRRDCLQAVVSTLESLPTEPVAPIDWKLNKALMALANSGWFAHGDSWWVEPGPIEQRSMRT